MGGRKYLGASEGRPSKKRSGEQSGSSGSGIAASGSRFQRKNSNKGGSKKSESRNNVAPRSIPAPSSSEFSGSSTSSQSSIKSVENPSTIGALLDNGPSTEYSRLFNLTKRNKNTPLYPHLPSHPSQAFVKLIQLCSGGSQSFAHEECLPECCFKNHLLEKGEYSCGFTTIQAIGLGIKFKEMISHMP